MEQNNTDENGFPKSEMTDNMNIAVKVCHACGIDHTDRMKFTTVYSKIRKQIDKSTEMVGVHKINMN